ncbi:MAG: glycosyltransferase, partial [Paludibacteraceae bacterium]|nr:glycosyltransferase [Paludibacteraceae bacterium]
MKTAVVILNWNGRKFLEDFLPSVCRDSVSDDSEVVVADNGSTDDSLAFLSSNYPQVKQLPF